MKKAGVLLLMVLVIGAGAMWLGRGSEEGTGGVKTAVSASAAATCPIRESATVSTGDEAWLRHEDSRDCFSIGYPSAWRADASAEHLRLFASQHPDFAEPDMLSLPDVSVTFTPAAAVIEAGTDAADDHGHAPTQGVQITDWRSTVYGDGSETPGTDKSFTFFSERGAYVVRLSAAASGADKALLEKIALTFKAQ